VSKKHDAENDAKHGEGVIIVGLKKFLKHRLSPFSESMPPPKNGYETCRRLFSYPSAFDLLGLPK
jgi:hypothetical protein